MNEKDWVDTVRRILFNYEDDFRFKFQGERATWLEGFPDKRSLVDSWGPKLAGKKGEEEGRRFNEWSKTKRHFTEDEVVKGSWIKISDDPTKPPRAFRLHYNEHTLIEMDLFKPKDQWYGNWEILDGVLTLVEKEIYIFGIVAAKDGLMHSGIDGDMKYFEPRHFRPKPFEPYAYFKVIHLV